MNEILRKTTQIEAISTLCNAKLAFIATDGKSASIKVLAQHIVTSPIAIHEDMSKEQIRDAIFEGIGKTQSVTNSRS